MLLPMRLRRAYHDRSSATTEPMIHLWPDLSTSQQHQIFESFLQSKSQPGGRAVELGGGGAVELEGGGAVELGGGGAVELEYPLHYSLHYSLHEA